MNDLPDGWVAASLADLCTTITDGDHQPPPQVGEGIPFLVIGNVRSGSIETEGARRVPETYYSALDSKRKPTTGDILYTVTGSYGIPVAVRSSAPFCVQRHIAILRPAHGVDQSFLCYALATSDTFQQATKVATGTAQKTVPLSGLRRFRIRVPPPREQVRLGKSLDSYISRLDAAVEGLKRVQANLKRYRSSVLKAAVEGRLVPTEAELARQEGRDYEPASVLLARILKERRRRWEEAELAKFKAKGSVPKDDKWRTKYKEPAPPDTSDLPALPEGWCWASVEQLAAQESYALAIGPFGSNLKVSDYREAGVPLVFVRNIRSGNFALETATFVSVEKAEELRAHQIRGGDILVTKMGEPPGETCLYPVNAPPAVITADCIKVRAHAYLPSPQFLVTALRSPPVQDQISRITQGVAQRKVSLGRFKGVALPLAPAAEMVRLHAEIQRLETITSASAVDAYNAVKKTERLRQSILRWAFEGRLVDQDADDEPADALLARIREERSASSGAGRAPKRPSAARKGTGPAPAPRDKKKAASRAKKTAP